MSQVKNTGEKCINESEFMLTLMKRFVIENHLQTLEQLTITPKQNQFKITLIRLTNCMTKEIQLCIGQQEEVGNKLIGLI